MIKMRYLYIGLICIMTFLLEINANEPRDCSLISLENIDGISNFFTDSEIKELKGLVYSFDSVLIGKSDFNYDQAYLRFLISLNYQANIYGYFPLEKLLPDISLTFDYMNSLDTALFNKVFIKQKYSEPDSLGVYHDYLITRNFGPYGDFMESLLKDNPLIQDYYDYTQATGDCDGNLDCLYWLRDWNYNNEGVRLLFAVYMIVWYDLD